jgi:hypothetical protein
VSSS